MITNEMIAAGLAAQVTDYRTDDADAKQVTVERAMTRYGFHHPIDGREMVQAIVEAAMGAAEPEHTRQRDEFKTRMEAGRAIDALEQYGVITSEDAIDRRIANDASARQAIEFGISPPEDLHAYQVRFGNKYYSRQGWQDASKERYDEVGEKIKTQPPYNSEDSGWERRVLFNRCTHTPLPARDRERDRQRFSDPDFNAWLDQAITENGEYTVWHQLGSTEDAYHGWEVARMQTDEDELQFYREQVGSLDMTLCRLGVMEITHEGGYEAAWKNTREAVERLAARQPVGDVPYGFVLDWKSAPASFTTKAGVAAEHRDYKNCNVVPVYRAPPAQALELGQFRASVQAHRDGFVANRVMTEDARDPVPERKERDLQRINAQIAECDRLLAVIDGSKAVPK